ncbi:MAG: ATP-dependent DNA helicase [Oscillospiraceae bacterium]|nr:ATP-dependent DNA helicase [Oscillospiraceae bacterium]
MPVVISTSSIALQKAIVTDYIPALSDILMEHGIIRTPLTAVIRKGKEHFICRHRLNRYCNSTDMRTQTLLAPYMGRDAPIDLTDADTLTPYMKRAICVAGKCNESCRHRSNCRYQDYLKIARNPTVDFQVTNHNYFLADTVHRAQGKRPLLPHYQLVIMDEAHKFLQAARSIYGLELTDTELPNLAQEIHAYTTDKSKDGVNVHKLAKKLVGQSRRLFRRLHENIAPDIDDEAERFPAVMDNHVLRHLKNIAGIAGDTIQASTDNHIQPLHKDRRSKALWWLDTITSHVTGLRNHSRHICWLEKRKEGKTETTALCAIPKDLHVRLHHDLWQSGIPMILTSGTLSASGDFTRAKNTLGLDRLPAHRLSSTSMPSPFDYKRNTLLYLSEATPFPDNTDKQYIRAIADEVERLVTASNGHAAVLFTSYRVMDQVYALLRGRELPFPLFRLERGGTHAIDQFKQSMGGVLLASGALWEGIDIPGDALSLLIIVKLPFAVPDPIGDYERSLCRDMNEYKAQAIVPDMLVKLKQGHGRLIRKETDTGVVAILDLRICEGGPFRNSMLKALPDCSVTTSVKEVQNFMERKKPPEYFSHRRLAQHESI